MGRGRKKQIKDEHKVELQSVVEEVKPEIDKEIITEEPITPQIEVQETPPPLKETDTGSQRLDWLFYDFKDITDNVYEAVMVAAHRARQIARNQKREIDRFKASQSNTEESLDDEENIDNRGVDHFHHPKPTIKALKELRERKFRFYYPEHLKK